MTLFLSLLLIVLTAVLLFSSYRTWPVSGHFGLFSIWTLFRHRSAHLPKHLILKNFSLSRIFMHYTVEMTSVFFGKRNLGMKVMYVQFGMLGLGAVFLYLVALFSLGLGNTPALLGALLFLFVTTRPQFIPDYSNAEPYYVGFGILAMGVLLFHAQNMDDAFLRVCLFSFIFVFAGLNAKVHFLFEPAVIGFTYVLATGGRLDLVAALALGCAGAMAVFVLVMRKNIRPETVGWLKNLVNYNRTVSQFSLAGLLRGLRGRFDMALSRSPLAGLLVLALLSTALAPMDVTTLLLLVWVVTAATIITAQGRFELYHFVVMFPALVLLSVRGLQRGFDDYGLLGLIPLLPAAFLARRAVAQFPAYFRQSIPLAKRLALAIDCYPYYWEIRFPVAIEHLRANPAPALAWGITPEFYHLADSAPVSSVTYIHRQMDYLQPGWGEVLRADVAKVAPRLVYDFNCWNEVYGRFNPVTFSFATGLGFRAVERRENVACYTLLDPVERPAALLAPETEALHFSVYGLHSQLYSPLLDALRLAGYDPEALSGFWRLEIGPLLACLAQGRPLGAEALADEEARLWAAHPGELAVPRLLAHLHRGETEAAREFLSTRAELCAQLSRLSLLAHIALECAGRLLGREAKPLRIDLAEINCLPVVDMFHALNTLLALAGTGLLSDEEKGRLFDCLKGLRLDGGDYSYDGIPMLEHALAAARGIDAAALARLMARLRPDPLKHAGERDSFLRLYLECADFLSFAGALPRRGDAARIALYGLTDDAALLLDLLPEGVQAACIADTYKHESVKEFRGLPVLPPALLGQQDCDALLLMMTVPTSIEAVAALLRQNGCTKPVYARRFAVSHFVWERLGEA